MVSSVIVVVVPHPSSEVYFPALRQRVVLQRLLDAGLGRSLPQSAPPLFRLWFDSALSSTPHRRCCSASRRATSFCAARRSESGASSLLPPFPFGAVVAGSSRSVPLRTSQTRDRWFDCCALCLGLRLGLRLELRQLGRYPPVRLAVRIVSPVSALAVCLARGPDLMASRPFGSGSCLSPAAHQPRPGLGLDRCRCLCYFKPSGASAGPLLRGPLLRLPFRLPARQSAPPPSHQLASLPAGRVGLS